MSVELKNLRKLFEENGRKVVAVDDVSVKLAPKDFVAVHGPSGCGKSTLLMMAGGLMQPDTGSVTIGDQSIYDLSRGERGKFRLETVGFVFQQFHLIPYLNVLENVLVPQISTNVTDGRERAISLLTSMGLVDRLEHLPSQLSVGEQQRVALARAVITEPTLILADEPTGNLDTENGRIVLEFLRDFAKNGGMVLMVSHDDRAIAMATRDVRMVCGKTVD